MILFPALALVILAAVVAQLWLVASGTAWTLVRHRRRERYHPALRGVVALTLVQIAAVLALALLVLAER